MKSNLAELIFFSNNTGLVYIASTSGKNPWSDYNAECKKKKKKNFLKANIQPK